MKNALALTLLLGSASAAGAQQAAAPADAAGPKRCLDLIRIENTTVVDNKHIVFHLSGGQMYLNTLDHPCVGLNDHDPFSYEARMDQLCDLDMITVLHQQGGMLVRSGPSCGIGKFEKVTKDQVDMLKRAVATHE